MHPPRNSKSFEDYCCQEILASIVRFDIKRLDFVFDVYRAESLKREERKRRGNEICFAVRRETAIPKNFAAFLCNDSNKTQLFELISNLVCVHREHQLTIVSTKGETVLSNKQLHVKNFLQVTRKRLIHEFSSATRISQINFRR